jgi:hypothetical protein
MVQMMSIKPFSPSVVDLGEYDCPIMGQTLLISFQN